MGNVQRLVERRRENIMSNNNSPETGGNLDSLVIFAREWFKTNNKEIPKLAKDWQKLAVSRNEVPPGTNIGALRAKGITAKWFIEALNNNPNPTSQKHTGINYNSIGLSYISRIVSKYNHSSIETSCNNCNRVEVLDYGTLSRMEGRGDVYCRYCRGVGGKTKDIEVYNLFEGYTALSYAIDTQRITYIHTSCGKEVVRSSVHALTSEYLVCEHCYPEEHFGSVIEDPIYGRFPSKIEHNIFVRLLDICINNNWQLNRQVSYDKLFSTGTKHTADFYIPEIDLVIEATTLNNKIGDRYNTTKAWKLGLSPNIRFVHSIKEVDDIVRPYMKV